MHASSCYAVILLPCDFNGGGCTNWHHTNILQDAGCKKVVLFVSSNCQLLLFLVYRHKTNFIGTFSGSSSKNVRLDFFPYSMGYTKVLADFKTVFDAE